MLDFYIALANLQTGQHNMAVTILEGEQPGAKALLSDRGILWQTEGCRYFQEYRRDFDRIHETGICEIGDRKVFAELLGQEKKLVICGAGHVSIPVIRIGLMTGFHVTVLEDRPKFADDARRAGAQDVLCMPFEQGLAEIEGDEDTFFVIVTRGHRYDQVCLEQIARKRHAYIGMIGSRRRVAMVKMAVIEKGASPDVIDNLHSPIGLAIGAETPEEIAVAIMAEIIEVKNLHRHTGYPRDILRAILAGPEDTPKILATIVSRKGSAPRGVGTRMLVLPDGSCVGTIGGGCVESDILHEALHMMRAGEESFRLCHVDMTGQDAEEDGMVCGGVVDILLELL